MMVEKQTIVIAHETLAESIASDAVTLATGVALMFLSVYLDIPAFQWVIGILFALAIIGRSSAKMQRVSLDDARRKLEQIETDRAPSTPPD